VLTGRLAELHFPPTVSSAENLRKEGIGGERVVITGNTGIDALLYIKAGLEEGRMKAPAGPPLDPAKKMILVTGHRRESFGEGFERICEALERLAGREDVELVYPVHPNPNVKEIVERRLGGQPRIHLIEPQDYVPFVDLMRRSYLILTDSGGVQEEAPSLGKPVLVLREVTERPEGVEAGTAVVVGTDRDRIVSVASELLTSRAAYERMANAVNPYGDGQASGRIVAALAERFG
ncbi:MAG: UDP-N-acetylglucosamine 2-epimerase (non-hydrolyzing), partial [Gemmatimonadales bacterium]